MDPLKQLSFTNFVTDLIFHPEHAVAEDQNKALVLSVVLGIFSLGIFPLVVSIGWGVSKVASWVKEKLSNSEQKTNDVFHANISDPNKADNDLKVNSILNLIAANGNLKKKPEFAGGNASPTHNTIVHNAHLNPVPEPKSYHKGGPKNGAPKRNKNKQLGKGNMAGAVFENKNNPKRAIKIISSPQEYEMGAALNHPVLAKAYSLHIKKYDGTNRNDKHKLDMEKISGKNITHFQFGSSAIPKEQALKLITQAKDCCKYLFRAQVGWKDVNDGNIFIENNTNNLRLIDFGFWQQVENPQERAVMLLLGAMEMNGWIIRNSSCVKKGPEKDRELAKAITFPENFFEEKVDLNQIISMCFGGNPYKNASWMKKIEEKIKSMDEAQLEAFISSYFDSVIENLQKA